MNSARAIAERRWRVRINWAVGLSWLALGGAVMFWGPIDRPGEAIVVAGIAYVSGILVGFDKGGKRRRFLSIRGPGPRISQSSGGRDHNIYQSYDILENRFELTKEDVERVGRQAVTHAPFVGPFPHEEGDPRSSENVWDAKWVLHTHDSAGRPTFLDAGSVLGMLWYSRADEDSPAFRVLRQLLKSTRVPQNR